MKTASKRLLFFYYREKGKNKIYVNYGNSSKFLLIYIAFPRGLLWLGTREESFTYDEHN